MQIMMESGEVYDGIVHRVGFQHCIKENIKIYLNYTVNDTIVTLIFQAKEETERLTIKSQA